YLFLYKIEQGLLISIYICINLNIIVTRRKEIKMMTLSPFYFFISPRISWYTLDPSIKNKSETSNS
ncbi:hypothetical protein AB4586_25720, partial [Vibrio sp. 10N.222.49.E4]|uniref:hypothetical protein n=1 Tax=Vibrio sp. 10N.222.49.E4 TaxID=3229616 RepID=UPI003554435B